MHPVEESCDAELKLHAALMESPRREVSEQEFKSLKDKDAEENYRIILKFRDKLLAAGTVEGCYMNLFKGAIDIPPMFVDQLAHVVLRNILEGAEDPLRLRAAELFYREQKATIQEGHALLADLETVEMHASGNRYGSIGRLIVEAQGDLAKVDLDVLDRANAAHLLGARVAPRHGDQRDLRPPGARRAVPRDGSLDSPFPGSENPDKTDPEDRRSALGLARRPRYRVDRDPEPAVVGRRGRAGQDAQHPRDLRPAVRRSGRDAR